MSKITLSVIVYAPCLNKTTKKSNKKQMISSADTFFWMTRYIGQGAFQNKLYYKDQKDQKDQQENPEKRRTIQLTILVER